MVNELTSIIEVTGTADEHWTQGFDLDPRECATTLSVADADCRGELGDDIVGGPDRWDHYPERIRAGLASGIVARLRRPVSCARPDDQQWLADTMASPQIRERLAGLLVWDAVAGFGADDSGQVIAADASDAAISTAVHNARTRFVRSIPAAPVLHVTAQTMVVLIRTGALRIAEDGEVVSGSGDPVVRSEGYDLAESATPGGTGLLAFYSSRSLDVRLTSTETSTVNRARTNQVMQISEGMGTAGIASCAVARVVRSAA